MPTESVQSGISDDAGKLHFNNNNDSDCVGPEAEVVGRSSGAEISGGVSARSGTIVEVFSSAPSVDHFAAIAVADSDMGNSINKSDTLAKLSNNAAEIFKKTSNDSKQQEHVAQMEHKLTPDCENSDSPSSSNVLSITTDGDSDVIPTGNSGIPGGRSDDVRMPGITREVTDSRLEELMTSALTVSQDTKEDSVMESLDVGLDNVDGKTVSSSLTENGPRLNGDRSATTLGGTDISGKDAVTPDHQNDNAPEHSSSQNNDFSAPASGR